MQWPLLTKWMNEIIEIIVGIKDKKKIWDLQGNPAKTVKTRKCKENKKRWCRRSYPVNLSYLFKCPDDLVALSGMKRTRVPFESAFALSREEDKVKAIPGWDVESPTSSYSRFSQAARLMKVLGKPRGRGQRTSSSPTLASAHNLLCAQKSPWQSIPEKHTQAYL